MAAKTRTLTCHCGKQFERKESDIRFARKRGTMHFCCSYTCSGAVRRIYDTAEEKREAQRKAAREYSARSRLNRGGKPRKSEPLPEDTVRIGLRMYGGRVHTWLFVTLLDPVLKAAGLVGFKQLSCAIDRAEKKIILSGASLPGGVNRSVVEVNGTSHQLGVAIKARAFASSKTVRSIDVLTKISKERIEATIPEGCIIHNEPEDWEMSTIFDKDPLIRETGIGKHSRALRNANVWFYDIGARAA